MTKRPPPLNTTPTKITTKVVENEAGSIGVDHDLLVGKGDIGDEEVVLLRNG